MGLLPMENWRFHLESLVNEDHSVRIEAAFATDPDRCPVCSAPLYRHGSFTMTFRDTPIGNKAVRIQLDRKRYRCRACGKTFRQPLTGVSEQRRMTERLIEFLGEESLGRTFADVARNAGVDEATVRAIFHEYTRTALAALHPESPRVLGIDEVHLNRRNRCVFSNVEMGTILEMLPNWSRDSVYRFLVTGLTDRTRVEVVVIDMHNPYRLAIQPALPNVQVVVDKFHVVRMANQALDRVRLDIRAGMTERQRRTLMRSRFLLLRRNAELDEMERMNLAAWLDQFPVLRSAYFLKEDFFQIYEAQDRGTAMEIYDNWHETIPDGLRLAYQPLVTAMQNWREEIFNYIECRYTNATTEALNGIIKIANRLGRGYNFRTLRAKMLLTKGVRMQHRFGVRGARDLTPDELSALWVDLGASLSTIESMIHSGFFFPNSTTDSG